MTKILSFFLAVSVLIFPFQGWAITDAEEMSEAITENVFEAEIPDAPEVNAGDVGRYTSIAAGWSGSLHISYFDRTNWDLKYAYYDPIDNVWSKGVIDSTLIKPAVEPVGLYTSIAVDARTGNARIAYYDAYNKNLKFAKFVGGGGNCGQYLDWKCQTIVSSGDVGNYPSIVVDSTGLAHISYFENATISPYGILQYAKERTDGTWELRAIDYSARVGWYTSIDVDSTNTPAISYYDITNGNLKYARKQGTGANCANGLWKCETVDSSLNNVGRYTSLEFDSNNVPHISYQDGTYANLKYAKKVAGGCGAGAWTCMTLTSAGSVGYYTSMAISSTNYVYVSFYDATLGDFRLQWTRPGSQVWYSDTMDFGGTVGGYSSFTLDSKGIRVASYYDYSNADLKFVKSTPFVGNCGNGNNWTCTKLD
ncbi:MAG: hypothetical protein HYV34_00885 [Candidatus Kerfeldbacteria bacterium]|nr:hypothetical protein [Candidatus Kerfeldbacteria bacterium]